MLRAAIDPIRAIRNQLIAGAQLLDLGLTVASRCISVDWQSVSQLHFVCKGNICRSPYAEARARALRIAAISSGIETKCGLPANAMASQVAVMRSLSLGGHRTATYQTQVPQLGELVLAMEPSHLSKILASWTPEGRQVTLLGFWCTWPRLSIADPFGRSHSDFEECFDVIDDALVNISRRMARQGPAPSS
jgi:protein-tyrosine phosphatase